MKTKRSWVGVSLFGCLSVAAIALMFGVSPAVSQSTSPVGDIVLTADSVSAPTADSLNRRVNEMLGLLNSSIVTLDVVGLPGEPLSVSVPLNGELYTLDLTPHSVRSDIYQVLAQVDDGSLVEVDPGIERTLRGTVMEADESVVAASLLDDGLYARIILPEELGGEFWVEPIAERFPEAGFDQYVIYNQNDVIPSGGTCAADQLQHPEPPDDPGTRTACGGDFCEAELACDADYLYYQDHGNSVANVETRINNVINNVNVQYERDVEITHVITAIIVRTSSGADPYTTNDPSTLLDQFRNYWRNNHQSIQRDMAELFTGRNMTGSTIGIAWLNAVCTNLGYSVVESDCCGSMSCSSDLSAHELGHNWGADHCSCSSYTMNAGLTCSNRFHPTSTIPEVIAFRNSRGCLSASGGCTPPPITQQPPVSQSACAGDLVTISVGTSVPGPQYQWRRGTTDLSDGGNLFGTNTATLQIFPVTAGDAATDYNCVVHDPIENCDNTSDNSTLNVSAAPVFLGQPNDATVEEGGIASFTVSVEDPFLWTYQWRKNGSPLTDGGNIFGATSSSLTIAPVGMSDAGDYDCVATGISGGGCSGTSNAATLTVTQGTPCPEDLNGDGVVDLGDLAILLAHYPTPSGAQPSDGDLDGDGDVDLSDLSTMLAAYPSNCP